MRELVAQFLDDPTSLNDEQFSALLDAVRGDEALARELKDLLTINELISREYDPARGHFQNQVVLRLRALRDGKQFKTDVLRKVQTQPRSRRRSRRLRPQPKTPWGLWLTAAAAAAMLTLGGVWLTQGASLPPRVGQAAEVHGKITVVVDGRERPFAQGGAIREGQRMRGEAAARMVWKLDDGTRFEMAGPFDFAWREKPHARELSLTRGQVCSDVVPQSPQRPLEIATADGSVRVLGTFLSVTASDRHTVVSLLSGKAAISSEDDQQALQPGHSAVLTDGGITTYRGTLVLSADVQTTSTVVSVEDQGIEGGVYLTMGKGEDVEGPAGSAQARFAVEAGTTYEFLLLGSFGDGNGSFNTKVEIDGGTMEAAKRFARRKRPKIGPAPKDYVWGVMHTDPPDRREFSMTAHDSGFVTMTFTPNRGALRLAALTLLPVTDQ